MIFRISELRSPLMVAIGIVVVAALATACAYPETRVDTKDEMGAIMVTGAPEGAMLVIDGIEAGPATEFSKKKSVSVLPGRHVISLTVAGKSVARREVHVGAGTIRTIEFSGLQ